jgi:hypothetical protein
MEQRVAEKRKRFHLAYPIDAGKISFEEPARHAAVAWERIGTNYDA